MARIVVVDDDLNTREMLASFLRRLDHDVELAANGKEAMAILDATTQDLVLTDINMPEMDGIEVINALREKPSGIPVIAMSGGGIYGKEFLLANAKLLGAVTTVAKPIELAELKEAIDEALAGGG